MAFGGGHTRTPLRPSATFSWCCVPRQSRRRRACSTGAKTWPTQTGRAASASCRARNPPAPESDGAAGTDTMGSTPLIRSFSGTHPVLIRSGPLIRYIPVFCNSSQLIRYIPDELRRVTKNRYIPDEWAGPDEYRMSTRKRPDEWGRPHSVCARRPVRFWCWGISCSTRSRRGAARLRGPSFCTC